MTTHTRPPDQGLRLPWLLWFDSALARIETVVSTVIFVLMLSMMVVQVTARYLFEFPLPWSEEMIRYMFVMTVFIGAGAVCKYRDHIEIDVISDFVSRIRNERTKARVIRAQRMVADLASLATLSIFCWYCYDFVAAMVESDQRSPAMDFPTYIVTGVMFLGVVLMIVHYLVKIVDNAVNGVRDVKEPLK